MQRNINIKYKQERKILPLISSRLAPVAFSGGKWQHGRQDGTSEELLVQVKSTRTNGMSLTFDMFRSLVADCNSEQVPLLVLDFVSPKLGAATLPEQQWVCIRLDDFKESMLPIIEREVTAVK